MQCLRILAPLSPKLVWGEGLGVVWRTELKWE